MTSLDTLQLKKSKKLRVCMNEKEYNEQFVIHKVKSELISLSLSLSLCRPLSNAFDMLLKSQ